MLGKRGHAGLAKYQVFYRVCEVQFLRSKLRRVPVILDRAADLSFTRGKLSARCRKRANSEGLNCRSSQSLARSLSIQ